MYDRKYLIESALWIAVFAASVVAVKWAARTLEPDSALRLLVLVPVTLAICAGLWVELRQVARMDELQRLIYLVATLSGALLVLLFCSLAYLGEALKLWPRVAPIWTLLVMVIGFGGGWLVARRRYG